MHRLRVMLKQGFFFPMLCEDVLTETGSSVASYSLCMVRMCYGCYTSPTLTIELAQGGVPYHCYCYVASHLSEEHSEWQERLYSDG